MRHRLASWLPLLVALLLAHGRAVAAQGTTTVILVRHAEKAAEPADDPVLAKAGARRARALVGHSNTVPAIVAALGAPKPAPICDEAYDDVYVVTVPATGAAHVIHARYGSPMPAKPGCGAMRPMR